MFDRDEGRLKIIEDYNKENLKEIEKPTLPYGTIVYCEGHDGTGSFYGIIYEYGVLELPYGSNAYINTKEDLHIGDIIDYWTIKCVCKSKLIIEEIVEE